MFMKRWTAFLLVCVCLMTACTVWVSAKEEDDLTVSNGCHSIDGAQSLLGTERLTDNVESVFLYETNSQTILYQWNCDKQVYPASLVKIMTALLVLEKGNLADIVTVSKTALSSVSHDAIHVDLQEGEKISVDDLMYCMLVYSANDAAAVLAEYIAGSQEAFVTMMNVRAEELGCIGTTFINAHGLHDDNQVMTARDICRILDKALEYETFRTYFGTVSYQVPATNLHEERNLLSNNHLMTKEGVGIYLDSRVTGGRTGVTSEGYRNIASVSQDGNMEVICIVTGSASKLSDSGRTEVYGGFPETITLMDKAYGGFARRQIIYPNQTLRQISVLNGDNDLFVTSDKGFSTVLPSDIALEQLTFTYEEVAGGIQVPITKGQNVGSLQVWYGSVCIAQTDVYAMNDVAVAVYKHGSYHYDEQGISWLTVVLIVIAVLVIGFVSFLMIARLRSKKAAAARMRSHSGRRR